MLQTALLTAFFALFFYVWGTTNFEGLMNYPVWRDMGAMISNEDFIELRASHGWKIFPLLVAPLSLLQIVTIALIFLAPASTPRWALWIVVALELIYMLATIFLEIPIHLQHDRTGYDRALFDRLITIDIWLRKLPRLVEAPFVVFLLWRALRS
jgi:hypothetical protein